MTIACGPSLFEFINVAKALYEDANVLYGEVGIYHAGQSNFGERITEVTGRSGAELFVEADHPEESEIEDVKARRLVLRYLKLL